MSEEVTNNRKRKRRYWLIPIFIGIAINVISIGALICHEVFDVNTTDSRVYRVPTNTENCSFDDTIWEYVNDEKNYKIECSFIGWAGGQSNFYYGDYKIIYNDKEYDLEVHNEYYRGAPLWGRGYIDKVLFYLSATNPECPIVFVITADRISINDTYNSVTYYGITIDEEQYDEVIETTGLTNDSVITFKLVTGEVVVDNTEQ